MKINFICHDLGRNGGTIDIIELANHLTDLGHTVNVIYPKYIFPNIFNKPLSLPMTLMRLQRELRGKSVSDQNIKWLKPRCNVMKVPLLTDKYIPDADFTFATWWETHWYVKKLSPSKGKKCYYIQHYETWGGRKRAVEATYKDHTFIKFVHSQWLKDKIPNSTLIPHAPSDTYRPIKRKKSYDTNIMLISRNIPWKGTEMGLKAFEMARTKIPNLHLLVLGDKPPYMPNDATYYGQADTEEMNGAYNLSDIFLFPSEQEGFGLPPLEAMRCKCAVISTPVGAVPDYGVNGRNIEIVTNAEDMAEAIIGLVKYPRYREGLIKQAYNETKHYTWKNTAKQYEKELKAWAKLHEQ